MNKAKVNNINILPVITPKYNENNVLGSEYFKNPYASVALIARTCSGKTTVIYRSLEARLKKGMKTRVVIFCPSVHHDRTYKKMIEMVRSKDIEVFAHEHFIDNGSNLILKYLNMEENKTQQSSRKLPAIMTDDNRKEFAREQSEKIVTKDKYIYPKNFFIFDDLVNEMQHKVVTALLSRIRHWKSSAYVCLHDVVQCKPSALSQFTDVCLFGNLSSERVQRVSEKLGFTFKRDTRKRFYLEDLYDDATEDKYNFLNCDRFNLRYRKNFDQEYIIEDDEKKSNPTIKDGKRTRNKKTDGDGEQERGDEKAVR